MENVMKENENKLGGIIGAFIGATVGMIPMVITTYIGFTSGWLGIITAITAFHGYKICGGPKNRKFAKTTIMVVTVGLIGAWMAYVAYLLFSYNSFETNNAMVFVIPFFAGFVGYGFINKRVDLYVEPDLLTRTAEAYETMTYGDASEKKVYLPDSRKTSLYGFTALFILLCPFLVIMFGVYIGNVLEYEEIFYAVFISIITFSITTIFVSATSNPKRHNLYAFVKTEQGNVYRVDLLKLNQVDGFQSYISNGVTVMNVSKMREDELRALNASIVRAISEIEVTGAYSSNIKLQKAIIHMKGAHILSDLKHHFKISYTNAYGQFKKMKIYKIYPGFHPTERVTVEEYSNKKIGVNVGGILLVTLLTALPILVSISNEVLPNLDTGLLFSEAISYEDGPLEEQSYGFLRYEIPNNHEEYIDPSVGQTGVPLYITPDQKLKYGINAVTMMGSLDRDTYFAEVIDDFETMYYVESYSQNLTPMRTKDGSTAYTGDIYLKDAEGVANYMKMVLVPDKNVVASFFSMGEDYDTKLVDDLVDTLRIDLALENEIVGQSFLIRGYQEYMTFGENQEIIFTMDTGEENLGTYQAYRGNEAIDFIISQPEVTLTTKDLEDMVTYNKDGFYVSDATLSENPELVSKDSFYVVHIQFEEFELMYLGYYVENLGVFDFIDLYREGSTILEKVN